MQDSYYQAARKTSDGDTPSQMVRPLGEEPLKGDPPARLPYGFCSKQLSSRSQLYYGYTVKTGISSPLETSASTDRAIRCTMYVRSPPSTWLREQTNGNREIDVVRRPCEQHRQMPLSCSQHRPNPSRALSSASPRSRSGPVPPTGRGKRGYQSTYL